MTHLVCQSKHVFAFSRRASVLVLLTIFLAAFLAQSAPAKGAVNPPTRRTSTTQLVGTAGNDVIVINDSLLTIRINSVTMNYDPTQSVIRIDGMGGNDILTYFSGSGTAHCLFDSDRVIFDTPTVTRFLVTEVERFRFNGSDNDTVTFNGTPAFDAFVSRVDYSRMISGPLTFEAFGEIDVIARARGGNDFAVISGSVSDDVVDVMAAGREAVVERPDATVSALGFARVQVFAPQGGFDSAILEDSPASDMLLMEAQETIFNSPNMLVELLGFESVDCRSVQGGTDMVEFHDIPSFFDCSSGATTDADPSWFISAETFSRFDGSNYSNLARDFEFTDYFPNYVDSRMRIIDSPGDDFIADPRIDHAQQTTLERRGIEIFNDEFSHVRRAIATTTVYVANQGGVDVVDSFNLNRGTQFSFPSVLIEEDTISSFGVTRFVGTAMEPDVFSPKTCFVTRDAEFMRFHSDDPCRVTVIDSPGDDIIDIDRDPARVVARYPERTIVATGELAIGAISENGGVDEVTFRSRGRDVRIEADRHIIRLLETTFPFNHTAAGFATARVITSGGDTFYDDSPSFDTINAFGTIVEVDSPDVFVEIFNTPRFVSGGANGGTNTATIADSSTINFVLPPGNWDIN